MLKKRAVGISAEMKNEVRDRAMNAFENGDSRILISTDSCSRALNLNVKCVINFDVPKLPDGRFNPKVYTYRASRAGRFQQHGISVTLDDGSQTDINRILKRNYSVTSILI